MKIVLLSDIHFAKDGKINQEIPERNVGLADILLLRLVHRINRWMKPDAVVICGDLTNDPADSDSLEILAGYIRNITAPVIAIPGNHDLPQEEFYRRIERPPEFLDRKGFRLIPFVDPERPGYNAYRTPEDIQKLRGLSEDFQGRVISIQHVPLCSEGTTPSPYYYENAGEIPSDRIFLALSGHFHSGFLKLNHPGMKQICATALCESPFAYLVIEIDETSGEISVKRETLRLPDGLCDYHIHTKLAYCQENLDLRRQIECVRNFNLSFFALTEHSGHLLVSRENYNSKGIFTQGLTGAALRRRDAEYRAILDEISVQLPVIRGMELDVLLDGTICADPELLKGIVLKLGAVHCLGENPDYDEAKMRLMALSEKLLSSGCQILAHPFRAFRRSGLPIPEELFAPMTKLLKKYGAAAEINFHTNDPEPDFFRKCLDSGVKLAFGSDAHNLYEVGELYPHMNFLEQIGGTQTDLFLL